jgi:DNA-binding CsgD family transcriptional regulator
MSHLIILTLVLNLMAGTAVFLYTLPASRRYRRPFLRTLLAYVLSFNGLAVVYLGYEYVLINVFRNDMVEVVEHPALFSALLFLVFCAEFGMAVNLFRLTRALKGEGMPNAAKALFALWAAGFAAATAWSLLRFFEDPRDLAFYRIHAAWLGSVVLIILSVLAAALGDRAEGGEDRATRRSFAWVFLGGYAAFGFSNLDFYLLHTGVQKYYDPVLLLLINLLPLLWLKAFYEKRRAAAAAPPEFDAERLARFCERFGISKREREIVSEVMAGKSNRDIEKALFISQNTVKNHLYSVYQKAGVGSRSQLIHRILSFDG